MCKQHWRNWLCLWFCPWRIYINIYIYIGFVTSKNEVFKPSHRQKSCTHIVPCSEKIRGNIWEKYIFHHHRWGVCCQWPQSWFLEANIGRVWPPALSQLGTYAPASNALLVEPGSHGRQPMGQPYFFFVFYLWTSLDPASGTTETARVSQQKRLWRVKPQIDEISGTAKEPLLFLVFVNIRYDIFCIL